MTIQPPKGPDVMEGKDIPPPSLSTLSKAVEINNQLASINRGDGFGEFKADKIHSQVLAVTGVVKPLVDTHQAVQGMHPVEAANDPKMQGQVAHAMAVEHAATNYPLPQEGVPEADIKAAQERHHAMLEEMLARGADGNKVEGKTEMRLETPEEAERRVNAMKGVAPTEAKVAVDPSAFVDDQAGTKAPRTPDEVGGGSLGAVEIPQQVTQAPKAAQESPIFRPIAPYTVIKTTMTSTAPVMRPQAAVAPSSPEVRPVDASRPTDAETQREFERIMNAGDVVEATPAVPAQLDNETVEQRAERLSRELEQARAEIERIRQESARDQERINGILEQRNERAKQKLEQFGLGAGIAKGLEAFKKINPKIKLALAVALAGASVMTGGATSALGLLAGGLSAVTFASREYEKDLANATRNGEEVNKGKMAASSLVKGLVIAVGTGALFSLAGDAINSAADSEWMKGLKGFFGVAPAPTEVTQAVTLNPTIIPDTVPTPTPAVEAAPILDGALETFGDYAVATGDNLTNIVKDQVLSRFPGAEGLTDFQRDNIVENLFKHAREVGDVATLSQFADLNLIHPGDNVNLQELADKIQELDLVNHAKSITR